MKNLDKITFIKTDDESIGLYDKVVNDIYHSKSGAFNEAMDKFIQPIFDSGIKLYDNINVLDICYGIGYNTKALLNKFTCDINVFALDNNFELMLLSPFIYDGINDDILKLFLIKNIIDSKYFSYCHYEFYKYVLKNYSAFLSQFGLSFIKLLSSGEYKNISSNNNILNLHNIYYNYISDSMKNNLEINKYNKCNFTPVIGDARKTIVNINNLFDIVFLDGFTPKKSPVLWTIDFLSLVKSKMKNNSILISYSKSIPFRSALVELGFYVGKTIINNIDTGTVASLNPNYINILLNDIDLKIINSRSGITYKDAMLCYSSDEIIYNRNIESINSKKISRTKLEHCLKNEL